MPREEEDFLLIPYERPPGPSRSDLDHLLQQYVAQGGQVSKLEMGDSYFMPKKRRRGASSARTLRR